MSSISSCLRLLSTNDVAWKRLLSTAAKGGDLLINGGEFAWLRDELGLHDTNIGVFNGEWAGPATSSEHEPEVSLQALYTALYCQQRVFIIIYD